MEIAKTMYSASVLMRIGAATALLIGAYRSNSFQFYTLLRIGVSFVAAYLIYIGLTTRKSQWIVVFGCIAVIFNPLIPLKEVTKDVWMVIDSVAAGIFLASIFFVRENSSGNTAELSRGFEEDFRSVPPAHDVVIRNYGRYVKNHPWSHISDAWKLPHARDQILEAMEWKEQQLCDGANLAAKYDLPDLPEIERHLRAVQELKIMLVRFAFIEVEDQERVDYFNNFRSINDIPKQQVQEFMALGKKYQEKSSRDFGIK